MKEACHKALEQHKAVQSGSEQAPDSDFEQHVYGGSHNFHSDVGLRVDPTNFT